MLKILTFLSIFFIPSLTNAVVVSPWGKATLKSFDILAQNSGGLDIVVDGDTAYLAAEWQGLYILDISDLNNVTVKAHVKTSDFGISRYSLYTLEKKGNFIYCGFRTTGKSVNNLKGYLKVVDVRDEYSPVVMSNDLFFSDVTGARLTGLYLVPGSNELFAALRLGGLALIDISIPDKPALTGWFDPGTVEHQQVVVDRTHNRAYSGGWSRGIRYTDISDPLPENWTEPMPAYPQGRYWYLQQRGSYLYAVVADYKNTMDEGLAIYDLSQNFIDNNNPPEQVSFASIPGEFQCESDAGGKDEGLAGGDPAPHQVYLHDDYAIVANGCMGIAIFDISDPQKPFYVKSYLIPGQVDWPWSVAKIGNRLLTVGRNLNNSVNNDVYVFTIDPVTVDFSPVFDVPPGNMIYSDKVVVRDLPHPVSIRIEGGEYSINGQAFTQQDGMLSDGDELQIRVVSSDDENRKVSAIFWVNDARGTFDVTTLAATDAGAAAVSESEAGSVSLLFLVSILIFRGMRIQRRPFI